MNDRASWTTAVVSNPAARFGGYGSECPRKKRKISLVASGPRGSV
jgi:hypothetical protein